MSSTSNSLVAYVLTIDSIKERISNAKKLGDSLKSLDVANEVTIIPAIYWKNDKAIIDFLTRFPEHTFAESYLCKCLKGQLATTLSHISIWRRLLESNHKGALVFEDDMFISDVPRFMEIIADIRQRSELEWVRIHLLQRFRDQVLQLCADGQLVDDPQPWGFATYYISRAGAKKMIRQCRNIENHIDWLPPIMRKKGLLESKTVTEVVVEHDPYEGDESGLQGRHKVERLKHNLQKLPSDIWTSPLLAENVKLRRFISSLNNMNELQKSGFTVLRGIFDTVDVEQARNVVLNNRDLFKNTRPSPSAGHLPGFHRFPILEQLHLMVAGNPVILDFLKRFLKGMAVRSIGLSDITINRSQNWHKDLLRGKYKGYMDGSLTWDIEGAVVFKVLYYLQDGASLKIIKGSHLIPALLDNDQHSEPLEDSDIVTVNVHAGDVVIMDVRASHRGADETAYSSGLWDDNPRILISTALGGIDCKLTRAMEKGNFQRLMEWMDHNP